MGMCSTGFASTLSTFGESDDGEDGSESEDEEEVLASLSHEELCEMLSETRAQLGQAAEIGQALMAELQQMELLKQDNAQLYQQKEDWESAQEEHEWRIEELEECDTPLVNCTAARHFPSKCFAACSLKLLQGAGTAPRNSGRAAG